MKKTGQQIIFLSLCLLVSTNVIAGKTQRSLSLVTGPNANIEGLTPVEVRKLFLGIPVIKNGKKLNVIRNESDPLLREVFLQKIIFMSERNYERYLLSRIVHRGGKKPEIYLDNSELVKKIQESSHAVTYMWSEQIESSSDITEILILWTGTIE